MVTLESSVSDAPNCGIPYNHHSDDSRGAFMLLEPSITLLKNIYSTSVTHADRHLQSSYFYSTATVSPSLFMLFLISSKHHIGEEHKGPLLNNSGLILVSQQKLRKRHRNERNN